MEHITITETKYIELVPDSGYKITDGTDYYSALSLPLGSDTSIYSAIKESLIPKVEEDVIADND